MEGGGVRKGWRTGVVFVEESFRTWDLKSSEKWVGNAKWERD